MKEIPMTAKVTTNGRPWRPRGVLRLGAAGIALALVAAVASVAAAAPTQRATRQANDILIGAPLPLSGLGQAFGQPYLKAMQLTVDAINAPRDAHVHEVIVRPR